MKLLLEMRCFLFFVLSCYCIAATELSVRDSKSVDDTLDSRELIFSDPLAQYCDNIEIEWNVFLAFEINSGILCTCEASLLPPAITTECSREFCASDVVCWQPELRLGFNLLNIFMLQLPFTAQICVGDITALGLEVPFVGGLCFDFFNPIFGLFTGLFSADSRSAVSTDNFSDCTASLDGQRCDLCEVCAHSSGGTGVRFGCPGFESVGCTLLSAEPLPTETRSAVKVDSLVVPEVRMTE